MFTPKNENRIKKAQRIADQALDVFNNTIRNLQQSNCELTNVIDHAQSKIEEHQGHIHQAQTNINANEKIINKLSEFMI